VVEKDCLSELVEQLKPQLLFRLQWTVLEKVASDTEDAKELEVYLHPGLSDEKANKDCEKDSSDDEEAWIYQRRSFFNVKTQVQGTVPLREGGFRQLVFVQAQEDCDRDGHGHENGQEYPQTDVVQLFERSQVLRHGKRFLVEDELDEDGEAEIKGRFEKEAQNGAEQKIALPTPKLGLTAAATAFAWETHREQQY